MAKNVMTVTIFWETDVRHSAPDLSVVTLFLKQEKNVMMETVIPIHNQTLVAHVVYFLAAVTEFLMRHSAKRVIRVTTTQTLSQTVVDSTVHGHTVVMG
jgi:hypothetical protein